MNYSMNYSMDYDMNYRMNYNKQYSSKCTINKWLLFLYVYYLSQNFYEERENQYNDLIIDTSYDKTIDEDYDSAGEDDYNLSIYEHDDSSNYFQAFTKAIFCLFD